MPEAFCGLETVRKNAQWTLWALWEKKLPKNRVSRPIGVTSHITPLPTGEGKGEGPLSFWHLCVLFFCVLCERKKGPPRKKERSSVRDIMPTMQTKNVNILYRLFPSTIENELSLKQKEALLRSNTCPSCTLKTPFLKQEGHVLKCYL